MPRIAFTIPIVPGKQDECLRILRKYKDQLDAGHKAIGVTQWVKLIYQDLYVELIDWKGASFITLLRNFLSRPEVQDFLKEMTPNLLIPPAPPGRDATLAVADFLEGRAMREGYSLVSAP